MRQYQLSCLPTRALLDGKKIRGNHWIRNELNLVMMAHRNRWFAWVYLLKMVDLSIAMLNYQRVMMKFDHEQWGHPMENDWNMGTEWEQTWESLDSKWEMGSEAENCIIVVGNRYVHM